MLANKVTSIISENLEAKFSVQGVEFQFFNKIQLTDAYVEDQQGDTLLFAPKVTGTIRWFNRKERIVEIGRLTLSQPTFRLKTDSSRIVNLKFITESLKNKRDTTRNPFKIIIHNFDYVDGHFSYQKYFKRSNKGGINFTDIDLNHLNIAVKHFYTKTNTAFFQVKKMNFKEKSGFIMKDFNSKLEISRNHMFFRNNEIITSGSSIFAQHVDLEFNNFKEFRNFANNIKLNIQLEESDINTPDLAFFVHRMGVIEQKIKLSGNIRGKVSNIHGRKIELNVGSGSNLSGKFDISGLPNLEETFWFIDLNNMYLYPDDLMQINIPGTDEKIHLHESLVRLGYFKYEGVFTGFYNDFVSYGKIETELGKSLTDIAIMPDTAKAIRFEGRIEMQDFKLGRLTNLDEMIGKLNMNVKIDGTIFEDNSFNSQMEGIIENIEINNYEYRNVQLNGVFEEKSFDGSVSINDPNIRLDFLGLLDFTSEVPEFDFTLNVPFSRLHYLNLMPDDSTAELSLLITANFLGNNLDNINGTIKLLNSRYKSQGRELEAYDFTLTANNHPDSSWIILKTDYLDAQLTGQYEFNKLIPSFKYLQANFLPSTFKSFPDTNGIHQNNFQFEATLKNVDKLSDFFFPTYNIAPGAKISGWFHPSRNQILLEGEADYFYSGKTIFDYPRFILATKGMTDLSFAFTCEDLYLTNQIEFSDFNLVSDFRNDSVFFGLNWFKQDSLLYEGNIDIQSNFSRNRVDNTLQTKITIPATKLIHKNIAWHINENVIRLDSNSVHFNEFIIKSDQKYLKVNGTISDNPLDTLLLQTRNLELNTLSLLNNKISFTGIVNGDARLSGLYAQPMFLSHLQFEDLHINHVPLGTGTFISEWDPEKKSVHLLAVTKNGNQEQIHAEGDLNITGNTIDLEITTDKLRIKIFQPFLKNILSDLNGLATGNLSFYGDLKKPKLTGKIELQKVSTKIDYLNTRYSFTDQVEIENNQFIFKDIEIFDTLGNQAVLNGSITAENFKDLWFDLQIEPDKLLLLNLEEWQNDIFYGIAYISGTTSIYGSPDKLTMDIVAKTENNTNFFLPLNRGKVIEDMNFVSFSLEEKEKNHIEERKQKYRSKKDRKSNLEMNINLETTPEAEAVVLFDPAAGGSLVVRGTGGLRMNFNTSGKFDIFGEYMIDKGTYNFSLSHVINKKFEVKQGSKITWTGNPTDATLDVIAIYKTRTSLYNLFYDDAYQRRIPVDCEIHLYGKLESPDINFNISLPTADEDTKTRLENSINTEEDLNKQFLSLLIINSFLPDPSYAPPGSSPIQSSAVQVTTAELLSNQLSNWVSQISNDFDIGFHYRPGDEVSSQEIEVALSTQILNDRVLINSSIDMGKKQNQNVNSSNDIVGDVSIEVKIDKKGKFRVKAFTRPNDKMIYESTPYTSGIGVFFREEFNSFGKLIEGYWYKLFKPKGEKKKSQKE